VIRTSTTLRFAIFLILANGFLDAYTYLARGGVFANVQTGNVILFAIELSGKNARGALSHLWPILAFLAGVLLSSHIKSGRVERIVGHPLRWTMAIQAAVLAIIGFVPHSVPHSYVTIPIAFVAGMQIGLFRSIGELTYIAVATTGNLMRFVEAGYSGLVDREDGSRSAFGTYGAVIAGFAGGAVIGGFATRTWGIHAIWLPAGFLALTLALFVIDERAGKEP
jgi:uncharacterized membrane protein YoaK (UPF0700 family)